MQHQRLRFTLATLGLLVLSRCGSQASGHSQHSKYAANQVLNWTEIQELSTSDLSKVTDTVSFTMLQNTQEGTAWAKTVNHSKRLRRTPS